MSDWETTGKEIICHFPSHLPYRECRVLDIGCLNGYRMETLRRHGVKNVYGTASNELALRDVVNPELLPSIRVGDFLQNNFPDGNFDVTLCMNVLEHVPREDTKEFLKEICRITSPEGHVLLTISEDRSGHPTAVNCLPRLDWYPLFASAGLIPTGLQNLFPGSNSYVLRRSPSVLHTAFFQKLSPALLKLNRTRVAAQGTLITSLKALAGREDKMSRKISYSQSGEDLIVDHIFVVLGVRNPSYLDIGAHHPRYLSNSALFYERGCRGINVEPDPTLFRKIQAVRRKDKNLNVGIAPEPGTLDFHIMSLREYNTFSKAEAIRFGDMGVRIIETIQLPVITVNQLIQDECHGVFPDFLSLDVEGLDLAILHSIDFSKSLPSVICVETIIGEHSEKVTDVIDFLKSRGYMVYGDTFINTIFLRHDLWARFFQ